MTPETTYGKDGSVKVLVHFLIPRPGTKEYMIPCMPGLKDFAANLGRTAPHIRATDKADVTCSSCMQTQAFKAAQ